MLTFFLLLGASWASTFGEKFDMKNKFTIQSIICSLVIMTLLCITNQSFAQGSVGIGTDNPHSSALLDVRSFTKGVLIPRLKEAERLGIAAPSQGLLVYDISYKAFFVYEGGWKKIISEDQLPSIDHIRDADNDTWIHTENNPDQDSITIQVGGVDMGSINNKGFGFKSPGSSLFIGENTGTNDDESENENIFIGENTGQENINGAQNIFIGNSAGKENVSGIRNLFIGRFSGKESDQGTYNVVVGTSAGMHLTDGDDNVILGDDAGRELNGGKNNVIVGSQAGRYNYNRDDNVFVGRQAGYLNHSGSQNVFVGRGAGKDNLGSKNIFIGNLAGELELGSERLYIDNSNTAQPLIYGEFDNDELTINGALKIKDEYTFPTLDGADGEVLGTDGSGVLSWVANNGVASSTMIIDKDLDTRIQVEELPDEDIIRFDLEGEEAMVLDRNQEGMVRLDLNSENHSVMIGSGAGEVNEAMTNVLVGFNAGQNNSSGSSNTMIGNSTGAVNTTGGLNTFVGSSTGAGNTTGTGNTLLGTLAGLFNNGTENVMVGAAAGSAILTGNRNVLLGVRAGQAGASASGNVKLGHEAGLADSGNDKLYIDNSSTSLPLIYGDFSENELKFNGAVGVNVNANAQFHVNSTEDQPATRIQVNGLTKLLVNQNGGVSVGANYPERTSDNGLYVHGNVNLGDPNGADGFKLSVNGKVICEELRVEDSGDWPDYVFEQDYKLLPLSEVNAFIDKEGHLPNIPSAKIVEAEGFDTGDMVKRLLEKIEELTLHTIRQQEQIDQLLSEK